MEKITSAEFRAMSKQLLEDSRPTSAVTTGLSTLSDAMALLARFFEEQADAGD